MNLERKFKKRRHRSWSLFNFPRRNDVCYFVLLFSLFKKLYRPDALPS